MWELVKLIDGKASVRFGGKEVGVLGSAGINRVGGFVLDKYSREQIQEVEDLLNRLGVAPAINCKGN